MSPSNALPMLLLLGLAVVGFGVSCTCDDDHGATAPLTLTGPRVPVGEGEAWTRVRLGAAGEPLEVAAVFTSAALRGLPAHSDHGPAHEYTLAMPLTADVPPYDHVTLDWNAAGYAPPGVYDVPHFDVHFYFLDADERAGIGPGDTAAFNRPLPPALLPPMYIETPGGVPRMGAHVVDGLSPEIAGTGPFTHTFIYGKYDGELVFLEPMVSMDFLAERRDAEAVVRRPERYGRDGYFPGTYAIRYDADADEYSVSLEALVRHP